jgi:carboxymethylenebutenolidase
MSGQDITISAKDGGTFSGYLALPEGGSGPGVVVIQEIFGVNAVMREITDDVASMGYVALCPDLFWRQEPGIQITDQSEAEWARAFELFNGFDLDKGVDDLDATIEHLRGMDACTGKVGSVGFCLGLHIATEDGFVPKENQAKVHAALDGSGMATLFDYEGKDHAFARKGGEHYDPEAAQLARERTSEFFAAHLR